jgi:lipopolysaccharide biosynthesis regulator YciM
MTYELLWLLLPVAAASGWYAAVSSNRKRAVTPKIPSLRSDYFKGLNYLLNEQPDKAIEVFTKVIEVDSDTVETHLALGNLFRRRGEVDRAIRIHQNLVARQNLDPRERGEALLELGQDYMRAGLLDRAEGLFLELVEADAFADRALRKLTDIYQQEKDWGKAVEAARRLEEKTGKPYGQVIAHYCCEQAEEMSAQGKPDEAVAYVKRALDISSLCVRASLVEGKLLSLSGDYRGAVRAYKRVEQQDPDYLPEIIESLQDCCISLGRPSDMADYLQYILDRYGGISVTLALANAKARDEGEAAAVDFLTEQLHRRPSIRGLDRLIELSLSHMEGPAQDYMFILKELTTKLLENRPVYRCHQCGFSGRSLHWQCPSCKHWGTIKPIQGVEGE